MQKPNHITELANILWDTLMKNTQWEQLNPDEVGDDSQLFLNDDKPHFEITWRGKKFIMTIREVKQFN
jgi:hypothetical protein